MKKFMKGCAVTALIFGVIGLVFATVGGAVAGASGISRTVEEATRGKVRLDGGWGTYPFGKALTRWIFHWGDYDSDIVDSGTDTWGIPDVPDAPDVPDVPDAPDVPDVDQIYSGGSAWYEGDGDGHEVNFSHSKKVYEGDVERYCPGKGIEDLEIQAGGCMLRTEVSPDENLYLEAEDVYRFQGYEEDGTLYIRSSARSASDIGDGVITLYIPEGCRFDEVEVEFGAGILEFPVLCADSASLDVGVGEIIVGDQAKVSELDVTVGAGSVTIHALQADELDVEVGMGAFEADRVEIGKSAEVECAMGSVEMTLKGHERDFNYELECAMGNIGLNGIDYGGFGQEQSIDNGASREISLECSMGYIGIWFED